MIHQMRAQVSNAGAVEQGTGTVLISRCIRCSDINAIEREVTVLFVEVEFDQDLLTGDG